MSASVVNWLLRETKKRRTELVEATFVTPPQDWAGFQKALGRYHEIQAQVEQLEDLVRRNKENVDDDDLPN